MYEKYFNCILDDDEKLIKAIRPNKKRYVVINSLIWGLLASLLGIGLIVGGVISYYKVIDYKLETMLPLTLAGVALFVFLIIKVIYILVVFTKTYYAYTNKRVIIRTGFIGADYKTLEFDNIGALNVKVSWLDKLLKPLTGTLYFGSSSAPMVINSHNFKVSQFMLQSIENPYDVFKEIKTIIYYEKNH